MGKNGGKRNGKEVRCAYVRGGVGISSRLATGVKEGEEGGKTQT
jgi:hypothetical protein